MTKIHKVTNHPVHILDENGEFSPTALIPFCDFGGDMSTMGVKIDQFDVPVCNSFKSQIIQEQLCYSVDPNKFKNYSKSKNEIELRGDSKKCAFPITSSNRDNPNIQNNPDIQNNQDIEDNQTPNTTQTPKTTQMPKTTQTTKTTRTSKTAQTYKMSQII